MKAKAIKWLLALAAILSVGTGCVKDNADGAGSGSIVRVGDPVPAFTVRMVDGTTVDIASLRGKVVLLTFWITECPYCQAEMKVVQEKLIDRFAGKDLVFLPIARGQGLEEVLAFRQENGYTFAMGIDPDRSIYNRFAESSVPRNYVIDRRGIIVAEDVGYTAEQFDALIERIAAEIEK